VCFPIPNVKTLCTLSNDNIVLSHITTAKSHLITARRYASVVYAVVVCPSVRPSVRLSVTSRHCTKITKMLSYRRGTARRFMLGSSCYVLRGIAVLKRFQSAKVTFKVIQVHWRWCHSIGHIRFPVSSFKLQLGYVSILHRLRDIVTHFAKFKEITWLWTHPFRDNILCTVAQRVERWTCGQQVVRSYPTWCKSCVTTLGNLFTPMCLYHHPSSITWYRPRVADALRLGR